MTLEIRPITLRAAQQFIARHHRHNKPPRGHVLSTSVWDGEQLVGVACAGRPVARALDDGTTLEVNRTCTDGSPNANSMLYGAIWRAARAIGYRRCITYTQAEESGASLRAVGWVMVAEIAPRSNWAGANADPRLLDMRSSDRDLFGGDPRHDTGGRARRRWEISRGTA